MISSIIQKYLNPKRDYIYGFADLKGLIDKKFDGFGYGISIGKKLDDAIVDELLDGPTLEYLEHYKQINKELADVSQEINAELSQNGVGSIVFPPTISLGSQEYEKYLDTLSYDISHKMVATRAGLGWIGKTDLLVSREFGPRLRLTTILIDKNPGIVSQPVNKSKCGNCTICVEKCPAQAANGIPWNVNVSRDDFFNAFKCREKCGELAKLKLNSNERICGLCVSVCPVGK
ncbi:MAG: hypothetical protein A2W99_16560 [Bacteroidetes bacterium GWF2_33_16]|nr:MAG: hypothetical protein A2X00_14235 [Bacteroidetes bacterium GWE2_32_14]OFY03362.1 MAG: hypothetical protein A2W99_16560 [Bacteroidetes bacterium GWF2_33_16]